MAESLEGRENVFRVSETFEGRFAKHFSDGQRSDIWRETPLRGDPMSYVSNRDAVLSWMRAKKLIA